MCWSSVTCSRLVSYAHWPLGRGEALMFGDFFAAKEFSRTSDCCGQTYNLKSLLGKYSGIWIFFFPLVNTCVLAGDEQRAVAGEKLRCLFPAVLISAVLLNSCGWTLSAWCQPCSDEICSCSIWIYSNIFQSCAWKVFFFFFYSHTHSPFLWKRSRGTNRSVTQISITPCWVCEISRCRDWSLVQSSLKRRMSLSLVGMSPTWNTRELIGQASNSLAVPRNET